MKYVSIPETVISIGTNAFSDCTGLQSVRFSPGIQTIKSWAFANCSALEEITIPNSIRVIEYSVFSDCSNLKTVHIQFASEKAQIVGKIPYGVTAPDTLYIHVTAFDTGTKIIFEPPTSDADVFEYIWDSNYEGGLSYVSQQF